MASRPEIAPEERERSDPKRVRSQALRKLLFADPSQKVYAILDGASNPTLVGKLRSLAPKHACLFAGKLHPSEVQTAPYVVELERDSESTRWILEGGWGRHWGIFAVSEADLGTLRRHLKTLLMVHDPDGRRLYFRYYDPRVFSVYLPTCNVEEMEQVFGPVLAYSMEDASARNLLVFERGGEGPRQRALSVDQGGV
jgi:hypothetical protein